MAMRWRIRGVAIAILLTFIFFFVLQRDGLRGVSTNPGPGNPGGTPAEGPVDEKIEEKFMEELDIFYGEVRK